MGGWLVLSLGFPLSPRHDEEDYEADDSDEKHSADDGANDQGQVTGAGSSLV